MTGIVYSSNHIDSKARSANIKGFHLFEKEQYHKSIEYFQKAISIDKNFATAYNNLGSAYYQLKKYNKAIECYKKVIELDEYYIKAYVNLAASYFWKGEYRTAYFYYKKSRDMNQKYVEERVQASGAKEKIEDKLDDNPEDTTLKNIYQYLIDLESDK